MDEVKKIQERYQRRDRKGLSGRYVNNRYEILSRTERESVYTGIITDHFKCPPTELSVLEIGAGTGVNILYFQNLGIPDEQIHANELLDERVGILRKKFSGINIYSGNALDIPNNVRFDVVMQSLVFTSVLDKKFKSKLSQKLIGLTSSNGLILWYDFIYDNPFNRDVKGIGKKEIKSYFPGFKMDFFRVTVVPPVGRMFPGLYPFFKKFLFMKSHLVVAIKK